MVYKDIYMDRLFQEPWLVPYRGPSAELTHSINELGLMVPLLVRPLPPGDKYAIVDGNSRFKVLHDRDFRGYVPTLVAALTDVQVIEYRLLLSVNSCSAVEYTRTILRLLQHEPTLTIQALIARTTKSKEWIAEQLSLGKLSARARQSLYEGSMCVINAVQLAYLSKAKQFKFLEYAKTMNALDFIGLVSSERKKQNARI